MLAQVLDISGEPVNRIGLVVDHSDAAVSLVQGVSSDHVVSVVLLPGALLVSGLVVGHSVLVGVGDVALLRRVVVVLGDVVVMVHVDVLLDGGQAVGELLHQQHLLDGEDGSGHTEQAQDEGDLRERNERERIFVSFCLKTKLFSLVRLP